MRYRRILSGGVAALLLACSGSEPGTAAGSAAAVYTPEIRFGMRVGQLRRLPGRQFADAPYVGLRDSTYRAPDRFGDLFVSVSPSPDDDGARTASYARAESVSLTAPDSASAVLAEARLRALLGAPRERCFRGIPDSRQLRALFWGDSGARGVLLLHPRGSWDYMMPDKGGARPAREAVVLTIGAEDVFDVPRQFEPCTSKIDSAAVP